MSVFVCRCWQGCTPQETATSTLTHWPWLWPLVLACTAPRSTTQPRWRRSNPRPMASGKSGLLTEPSAPTASSTPQVCASAFLSRTGSVFCVFSKPETIVCPASKIWWKFRSVQGLKACFATLYGLTTRGKCVQEPLKGLVHPKLMCYSPLYGFRLWWHFVIHKTSFMVGKNSKEWTPIIVK